MLIFVRVFLNISLESFHVYFGGWFITSSTGLYATNPAEECAHTNREACAGFLKGELFLFLNGEDSCAEVEGVHKERITSPTVYAKL